MIYFSLFMVKIIKINKNIVEYFKKKYKSKKKFPKRKLKLK